MHVHVVAVVSHQADFAVPARRVHTAVTAEAHRWLRLEPGEQPLRYFDRPDLQVVWGSLWPDRPIDQVRLDLEAEDGWTGSRLRWTLACLETRRPDRARTARLRRRLDEIFAVDLAAYLDRHP